MKKRVPYTDYSEFEDSLKHNAALNFNRPYQQCTLSVMDTIADPNISFDENGVCNYYHEYKKAEALYVPDPETAKKKLERYVNDIRQAGKGKKYDCILGLSGGADSTYLAYFAKQHGLRPLLVHFDYGWNSELAVSNIEKATQILGFDLYTYVINWEQFRDLQRAYFKASVLDLDVPADHLIFGALFKTANSHGIKYVLSGNNVVTEFTLPKTWNYNKFDLVNLRNIHKQFGEKKAGKLPLLGLWQYAYYQLVKKIDSVKFLDLVPYNKDAIKELITREVGWTDYGGKHHESVFTRFYQGYILPVKFGVDKRKAHLSNLVFSGQITREEALAELKEPPYSIAMQEEDWEFVAKKLGFSEEAFEQVLTQPNRKHEEFGTDRSQRDYYFKVMETLRPLTRIIKKLR